MTKLTDVQKKLAEQLLLSVKNHEMNVEYNELAARINPPIHWRQVGKNIGEVSKLCHELGLPLLSAKVVNKNTQKAGEGFYPLYAMLGIPTKGKTEKELFREERDAIRNCKEWYKLEDYLGLNIGFDRPDNIQNTPENVPIYTVSQNSTNWLISCNPKYYHVDGAFAELPVIDWKQSCEAQTGDIVYIYVSSPYRAVKYKCRVEKANKPLSTIDDSKFVVDGTPFNDCGNYMELKLLAKLSSPVNSAQLKSVGINFVQGPIRLKPDALKLIEEMGFLELADDEPLQIPVVKESVIVPPPPEYLKPDVRRFTVSNPTPFHKSVDVLNYGLGIDYLGKIYGGWQKGAFEFTANGTAYMVWFPKLSMDGKPASSSGWINTTEDDGRTIIEKASESNHELGYEVADCIRLVFTKTKNEPYYFAGVYLPDKEHSSYQYHVYKRAADVADFTGEVPHILYYKKEDEEDEALIAELKADALTGAPAKYQYAGLAKNKANPVEISGHKVYPRDRQTAINALSHADYRCEINSIHPTFLRRNSSKPYTEPHHLIPMAFSDEFDVSLDVEENIVSLCSNCHNHIHYGQGASELLTKLYHERKEALKCVGIDVSLEELLSFYE